MSSFTSIPVIDIGPLVSKSHDHSLGEDKDVQEVVKLLDAACKDVGFFYAKGHGMPSSLTDAVLDISREFFHLTFEDKLRIKMKDHSGFRGYQKLGENVTKGRPDLHEAIDYYKEFQHGAYGELGHPLCGPNQWPDKPPKFRTIMEEYIEVMKGLAQRILCGISMALGGPPEAFRQAKTSNPFWVMRVIGYPPLKNLLDSLTFDESEISCGAHTDYGLLTLVNQDCGPCALQVRNQAGDWIWAKPIPGTFVVNIGDMLKIFSNGRYQPTLHRVINRNSVYRVSVPFFLEPNFDAVIEPLECCRDGGDIGEESKCQKPVIYGEHLVNKVLTNFY